MKMPHMARMDKISSPLRDNMSKRMEALCLDSSPDFGSVRYETNKVRPIGDKFGEMMPIIPNSNYRERSSRLKQLDDDKNALIDELVSKLESSQQQLHQFQLDQDRDTRHTLEAEHVRDSLQLEVDAIRTLLDRNSYVTILIDGDALTFEKEYLNRGAQGGLDVARSIYDSVNRFASDVLPNLTNFKVHVKLFADIRALSETLMRTKQVDKASTFENFLIGLLNSDILVDIVDTSLVKGLTRRKFSEAFRHDYINIHCSQLFFCAIASQDLNNLLDEHPDIPVHERVTFLEVQGLSVAEQFQHEISTIKMDVPLIKVPTGWPMPISTSAPPTKIATPVLARIPSTSSTKTVSSGPVTSAGSTPQLTWAAMTAQPFVPKATNANGALTPVSTNTPPPPARITAPGVPRNKYGQRIDPVDATLPYQELQRIKRMKLCNVYYLISKTECAGNCGHSHSYPLSKYEKSILKEVARMTPCHNKTECDDIGCIYGHRCPQNKPDKKDCFYKDQCRFHSWGHAIDENVVKIRNIK